MFNLFPHNISNVFEAVSSLVLGAGVSAAFYAATATCFFLKDRHGKDSYGSHYWSPNVDHRMALVWTFLPEG